MIREFNLFRTGEWGELPTNSQFTTEEAGSGGSTSSAQPTSTDWQSADPSMAPDVFTATVEEATEAAEPIARKILGLTPGQWLLAGLVILALRK